MTDNQYYEIRESRPELRLPFLFELNARVRLRVYVLSESQLISRRTAVLLSREVVAIDKNCTALPELE